MTPFQDQPLNFTWRIDPHDLKPVASEEQLGKGLLKDGTRRVLAAKQVSQAQTREQEMVGRSSNGVDTLWASPVGLGSPFARPGHPLRE